METIIIRNATGKDLNTLLGFEQEIIREERSFDSTLKKGNTTYYGLQDLLDSPDAELVVATCNDEVIGSGYAQIRNAQPFLEHQTYAHLGFMYVAPGHRGKGVSKRIIEALQQWANARNITEIRLEVYYTNQPALSAYQKAGFEKHMIEMRMRIEK